MKIATPRSTVLAALAVLCLCLAPALAGSKPPESTSKVKKVLLYNKAGGWVTVEGMAEVKRTFVAISEAKGFDLVQLADDGALTLDYLRQFQVIVWNNNTNGGASVPSASARQAILDYVRQGGGWLLINGAGDHGDTWPGLGEALGTRFTLRGKVGPAEIALDSEAAAHPELKWMLEGFPAAFELNDTWFSFQNSVRSLPGVTVVATARAVAGAPDVLVPMGDGSADHVYIWAREVGQGRLLYNAIGYGTNGIMGQQDSIVPKLYWDNLRYAAGDYQNGCTTVSSPGYDLAARVHVEADCAGSGVKAAPPSSGLVISRGNLRMRLAAPEGVFRVRLRDLRGSLVWERTLPAGAGEVALDGAVGPGVYHIEVQGAAGMLRRRLALP